MLNKKILFSIITGMILVTAAVFGAKYYIDYRNSLTQVTFTYNSIPGATVKLYKGDRKDLVNPNTKGDAIATVKSGGQYQLEDWPYVAIVSGDNIEPTKQIIYPHQTAITITLNISKNKSALDAALTNEQPLIQQALETSNTKLSQLYNIQNVTLFGDGNWASARLSYRGPDSYSRDYLAVVLQKQNGTWQIAAGPKITISRAEVPNAPEALLWSITPKAPNESN